MGRRAIAYLE